MRRDESPNVTTSAVYHSECLVWEWHAAFDLVVQSVNLLPTVECAPFFTHRVELAVSRKLRLT